MSQNIENTQKIKVSTLSDNQTYTFSLVLSADESRDVCESLGLSALRKTSLKGTIAPSGEADWTLKAKLGATVVQPCVVTLSPVTTRVDDTVERLLLHNMPEHAAEEDEEIEMSDDERIEPLGAEISLINVFLEALALSLPAYPRAEGAELSTTIFSDPDVSPMNDDDARPFAGLAALKDQLQNKGD